jgi:high-affinity iron transporter
VTATFLIFLREGTEASMIIAILCAYLDKIGQRRHFRDVFLGVAAAMVLVLLGGVAIYLTLKTYAGSTTQTIFETCTYVVAAVALTYMTFWMRNHSRTLGSQLRERAEAAMDGRARFGLGVLAFQAVGREGLETMVFTLAIVLATSTQGVLAGGAAGLAVALAIAAAIYRFGKRINIGAFFNAIGALLMIFAAGLIADAVENVQHLGLIHFLNDVVWNSSNALSENSTLGDVLHAFFGYADQPTVLQLICYFVYLAVAVTAFLRLGRRKSTQLHQPLNIDRSRSELRVTPADTPRHGTCTSQSVGTHR